MSRSTTIRSGLVLLVAVLATVLLAAPATAVVGAPPASRADYPAFAIVGAGCGGTLIAPDRVLTAAHCRDVVDEQPVVRVGPQGVRRNVRRMAIHPVHVRYQRTAVREFPPGPADLMLLELDRRVPGVTPATIARAADGLTRTDTTVTTIGRGATAPDGTGQGTFRAGDVQVQSLDSCSEQVDGAVARRWSICTRDPRMLDPLATPPFVSACVGDSGGPLLARGRAVVIGVVSWGPACGTERDPEIYANAVEGRAFALARSPIWAPQAIGRPHIGGTPRVGRVVTCDVRWRVRPTHADYDFIVDGFQAQEGPRNSFRIGARHQGHKLSCTVGGSTAGGTGGTQLAPAVRVRG